MEVSGLGEPEENEHNGETPDVPSQATSLNSFQSESLKCGNLKAWCW